MERLNSRDFFESKELLFYVKPYEIKSGERIALHSHEFFELVYISEGSGKHFFQGMNFTVSEGDVFIIEPGKEHGYEVEEGANLLVYNILFEPALLSQEMFESLSQLDSFLEFFYLEPFLRKTANFECHLVLNYREQIEMNLLVNRLLKDFEEKDLGYRILIKTRMLELFIFLSRCYHHRNRRSMNELIEQKDMIQQVCEFIKLHYNRPLSLEQVSKLCGMSRSAFTNKFKEIMGKTFIEYRNEIRIQVAKDLLKETDKKIILIAHEVGFEDISYFNRAFKKQLGIPPSSIRHNLGK